MATSDPWNVSPEAVAAQERQMVADLGTAYDLSSQIKNRNTNRYSYPTLPNFNQELQIDRARAQADAMNKIRQQTAYRKSLAEATASGQGGGNQNALGSFLQGAGALAPWVLGQNGTNDLMRNGVLGWTKDAFGNWKQGGVPTEAFPAAIPTEIFTPYNLTEAGFSNLVDAPIGGGDAYNLVEEGFSNLVDSNLFDIFGGFW